MLIVVLFCCDARYVPEDGIYNIAEKMPLYGDSEKDLNYYITDYIKGIEVDTSGTVFVSFVVDSLGHLNNFKITRSLNEKMDSMAIAIIKNAPKNWQPGLNDEKPVSVKVVYPVKFK